MSNGTLAANLSITPISSFILGIPVLGWVYGTVDNLTTGSMWSAWTGTVSPAGKQSLIHEQTQSMIQAGADPTQARAQAENDVTTVLTQSGADPSQAGLPEWASSLSSILTLVLIALGVYVLFSIFILKRSLSETL